MGLGFCAGGAGWRAIGLGLALTAMSLGAMAATQEVNGGRALDPKEPIAALFAALNDTEAAKRDADLGRALAEGAVFSDAETRAVGHKAIAARLETLRQGQTGLKYQAIGAVERQHDALRVSFEVADKTGTTAFEGLIFALVGADGKLERVDLFKGPAAAPLP